MVLRSEVGCVLAFEVAERVELALQVAVAAGAGTVEEEDLQIQVDGRPVQGDEVPGDRGGRLHVVRAEAGRLTVQYRATVSVIPGQDDPVDQATAIVALRQSRYCPSDALEAFADTELAGLPSGADRGPAIAEWVHQRLRYELGASGPLDNAVDTLLAGRGVCRDFAHLTVALCRAVGVPARLASAYAPGLSPMDFHALVEIAVGGRWEVVDATRLAPRQSLVRIATGRDAADTAFSTTLSGAAELLECTVTAIVDGELPTDDHQSRLVLA